MPNERVVKRKFREIFLKKKFPRNFHCHRSQALAVVVAIDLVILRLSDVVGCQSLRLLL
jgi:hypothetical protein